MSNIVARTSEPGLSVALGASVASSSGACGRCSCCDRSWWCGDRRCNSGRSLIVWVDTRGLALSAFASLASLIRPEEHIEGAARNRHVRGVVLAELLLSDLQEVAAPVTVGVLRGQGERRTREVQLALGFLCFLELDDTLDVLAVGVGILGGEVDRLANSESDRLLGLARRTSVTLHMQERGQNKSQRGPNKPHPQ